MRSVRLKQLVLVVYLGLSALSFQPSGDKVINWQGSGMLAAENLCVRSSATTCSLFTVQTSLVTALVPFLGSVAAIAAKQHPQKPTPSNICPSEIETLTPLLLRDLPGYANRVMQRTRDLDRDYDSFGYIIVAGRPEFEPLPLTPGQVEPITSNQQRETVEQVFFTTLERRYSEGKAIKSQNFHWLFLVPTEGGWRLVLLFTRYGSSDDLQSPTPPEETSEGVIGQAIELWLRDCRAGAIRA